MLNRRFFMQALGLAPAVAPTALENIAKATAKESLDLSYLTRSYPGKVLPPYNPLLRLQRIDQLKEALKALELNGDSFYINPDMMLKKEIKSMKSISPVMKVCIYNRIRTRREKLRQKEGILSELKSLFGKKGKKHHEERYNKRRNSYDSPVVTSEPEPSW